LFGDIIMKLTLVGCLIVVFIFGNSALDAAEASTADDNDQQQKERPSAFGDSQGELVLWKRAFAARAGRIHFLKKQSRSLNVRRFSGVDGFGINLQCFIYHQNGQYIAVGNGGSCVSVVDLKSGVIKKLTSLCNDICQLAFHPNCRRLIAGDYDGWRCVIDFNENLEMVQRCELFPIQTAGANVMYSPDGRYITCININNDITISDARDLSWVKTLHAPRAQTIAYNADGTRLVAVDTDGTVQMWDPASIVQPIKPIWSVQCEKSPLQLSFSPDNTKVILSVVKAELSNANSNIVMLDAQTGQQIWNFPLRGCLPQYCMNTQGCKLIIGSECKAFKLIDVQSGEIKDIEGYSNIIGGMYINRDEFVICSQGGKIHLGNGRSDCLLQDLRDTSSFKLIQSPTNSNQIAALGYDTVYVLDIPGPWEVLNQEQKPSRLRMLAGKLAGAAVGVVRYVRGGVRWVLS